MDALMELLKVFVTGGLICVIGQILLDTTNLTAPRILVIYVVAGGLLTALGWYQPIVDFGGSGATVPLTGFGYTLVKGALEGLKKEGILGVITGGLKSSAAGISVALVFGYIIALIFNPKAKD